MKKSYFYFLGLSLTFLVASCGTNQSVSSTYNADGSTQKTISKSTLFGERDVATLKEEWEFETLVETGEAPVLNKYEEASRNKLLARKGAILEAQRKLSEKIGTIRLNATTTMQDFSTTDFVQSRLNVHLKEVQVIGEEHDEKNGIYKVTIQMPKVKVINVLEEYFNI